MQILVDKPSLILLGTLEEYWELLRLELKKKLLELSRCLELFYYFKLTSNEYLEFENRIRNRPWNI